MQSLNKRDLTDKLYFKLRSSGYSTLGRRYGTYIPDPPDIGEFQIDILAKQKKEFAIGIVIDDLSGMDMEFIRKKIKFLAERKSTYSGNPVKLFIALARKNFFLIKHLVETDLAPISENIELVLCEPESEILFNEALAQSKTLLPRFIN